LEREGSIVAPCNCRPTMPAARRGPDLLFGLPGAQVAATGVPAAGGRSRCCRLRSAIGWGAAW